MTCLCDGRSPFVGHWSNNARRIGGNFFRRIEKQVRRDIKNVGNAVASAAEHVEEQVRRDGRHIDQFVRRAGYSIDDYYSGMVDEADQFIRQTAKHGPTGKLEREFRRNPEAFAAIGAVLMLIPGPWMIVGAALVAAAQVRMSRNDRKLAEKLAEETATLPPPGGSFADLLRGAMDWMRKNPGLAIAAGFVVWQLLERRKAKA